MWQKLITIILGLIIVGGLAWYIDKNYVRPSDAGGSSISLTSSPDNLETNLVYVTSGATTEIWKSDVFGKKAKLFSDADESLKIQSLSNLAPESSSVLAIAKSNSQTKLVLIGLNDAKSKVIKEQFSNPVNISLSSDGKKFAYTKFSNVEDQYGYTLFWEEISGPKIEEVVNSSSEIITPVWSDDSSKIYFGKTEATKAEILSYTIDDKKTKTVANLEKIVDWISFSSSDKLIVSERKFSDNNSGEIFMMNNDGTQTSLANFSGGKAAYAYLSRDNDLAYLVAQYAGKIDAKTAGQIYIFGLKTNKKQGLQKGIQILGWTN